MIVVIGENVIMETAMVAEHYHLYINHEKGYVSGKDKGDSDIKYM